MPKFEVSVGGKKYRIDAPDASQLPEIVETISAQQPKEESQISSRPDLLKEAMTDRRLTSPVEAVIPGLSAMREAPRALKAMGGLYQRAEAIPANIAEEIQTKKGAELLADRPSMAEMALGPVGGLMRYRKPITQALTGERLGQMGDVFRRAGVPEPIAAIGGLAATAGLGNLATRGRLAGKAGEVVKAKTPRVMGKTYTRDRAVKAIDLIDEARSRLGKSIGEGLSKYGDDVIDDVAKFHDDITQLPKNILSKLDDPIYAIEREATGAFRPTIANIQKIKRAISDVMTSRDWADASSSMAKQKAKFVYGKMAERITTKAPALKGPIKAFDEFMNVYDDVKRSVETAKGGYKERGLRSVFSGEGEYRIREAWEKMVKYSPEIKQIIKDMTKYTKRQATKESIKRLAPGLSLAGGGVGVIYFLKKLYDAVSDQGYGGSGGDF